jgi:hypothetical protein
MRNHNTRLAKIEDRFRCARHQTPLRCRCEMPANPWTPEESADFGRILASLPIRFDMLTPGPACPRCQRVRYCPECQGSDIRLTAILATLRPGDQHTLVDLLGKVTHAEL